MNTKNILKAVGITIAVLILLIIGGIVFSNNETVQEKTSAPVVEQKAPEMDYAKQQYMSGCFDGSNYEFCDCSYDKLVKEFGVEGIIKIGLEYDRTGYMEDKAIETVLSCI